MIFATGLVIAAAVAGVSAQMSGVSQQCQSAATGLLTGPAGTCLGVSGLLSVAMTPANQSLVGPINTWLTSTCAQPACTNATLESAIANLTTGCATEFGINSGSTDDIKNTVLEWYSIGREVACLKDSNNSGALCVPTTLKNIEGWIGQNISISTISTGLPESATSSYPPANVTCTTCIQGAYSLIRPKLSNSAQTSYDRIFDTQCGSNFTSGALPAGIQQSANSASPESPPSNNALSMGAGLMGTITAAFFVAAGAIVLGL